MWFVWVKRICTQIWFWALARQHGTAAAAAVGRERAKYPFGVSWFNFPQKSTSSLCSIRFQLIINLFIPFWLTKHFLRLSLEWALWMEINKFLFPIFNFATMTSLAWHFVGFFFLALALRRFHSTCPLYCGFLFNFIQLVLRLKYTVSKCVYFDDEMCDRKGKNGKIEGVRFDRPDRH